MPLLYTSTLNAKFHSRDEGVLHADAAEALSAALPGVVTLAREEIQAGERSAAIEISIEDEQGAILLRSVVALSLSPLLIP